MYPHSVFEGRVRCWGRADLIGQGSHTVSFGDGTHPMSTLDYITFSDTQPAVEIATGTLSSCALFATGGVRCWGVNANGELGTDQGATVGNDPGEMAALPYVNISTAAGGEPAVVVDMDITHDHTCVALASGRAVCWGKLGGGIGQPGSVVGFVVGNGGPNTTPVRDLPAIAFDGVWKDRNVTRVAAGESHSCFLFADAAPHVLCIGSDHRGSLGTGGGGTQGSPWLAEELVDGSPMRWAAAETTAPVEIHAGYRSTCVRFASGALRCYGDFGTVQLPVYPYILDVYLGKDQTSIDSDEPLIAFPSHAAGVRVVAVALGGGGSSFANFASRGAATVCASLANGAVRCFSMENQRGHLGVDGTQTALVTRSATEGRDMAISHSHNEPYPLCVDGSARCDPGLGAAAAGPNCVHCAPGTRYDTARAAIWATARAAYDAAVSAGKDGGGDVALIDAGPPSAADVCVPCPAGSTNPTASSTTCTECPAGTFSAAIGASKPVSAVCQLCPPSFSAVQGSKTCGKCALGTQAPGAGMAACLPCGFDSHGIILSGGLVGCQACGPLARTATDTSSSESECKCGTGFLRVGNGCECESGRTLEAGRRR
jgi:hypothetical protein